MMACRPELKIGEVNAIMPFGRSRIAARIAGAMSAVLRASTGYSASLRDLRGAPGRVELGGAGGGIPEHGHVRQRRDRHLQDLEPFPRELRKVHEHAREVAAGPGKRLHESRRDGVTLKIERNHRDRRGGGVHRHHSRAGDGEDEIGTECR
jgi:hypothetical protein